MKTLTPLALIALAACAQPEPIIDYDAPYTGKYTPVAHEVSLPATPRDICFPVPVGHEIGCQNDDNIQSRVDVDPVPPGDGSDDYQPPSKPDEGSKHKDDNSDANGKGGNKHDRDDKEKPSQEIAEEKKS